ncbi:ankyrin repeat-containing domain protein [Coprinopsis sp. MPI-PUGE-AT-0042]|nr:ankyrin repeat-containing domain protein [Coprinopsis sp. MPI-PUGE-AT-0042]
MFSNATDLKIVDSSLTVAGGDVVYNNIHCHYERPRDVWAILHSIPNFRQIYQDMLSKATLGTGMWLLKGDKFRLWLEPNGDIKVFWGSGIPGAGKTLLASIVIEHLEALGKETHAEICVCYVYFRYSDCSEITVRRVLEILVMQTLERHPQCLALIEKTYDQHLRERTEPTEAQLLGLLRELTKDMAITFYVLDALDEAPTKIQLAVDETLASLNVKLFITSRPLEPVEANFPEAHTFHIVAQDTDIDLHIAKGISKSAALRRLLQVIPSLRDGIISSIKRNCGGMFLHASLQLDALGECFSAQDVRDTLKSFPSSIEDVYRQTWARISNEGHNHASLAKGVLVWVLNASRSMTIRELERVVATSPDTHKFEPDRLVPETTLISLCGGLIVVEEESRLVRLVHYTAKRTLEDLFHEEFPHPHTLLAAVCMTHLTKCGFQDTTISSDDEFRNTLEKDPLLAYASEAWAFHARAESEAFPAFTSPDRSWFFDILTPLHILGLCNLPLALIEDFTSPNLTTKVLQQTPLILASRLGHEELVTSLLALSEMQTNFVVNDGWSALMEAARNNHIGVVALLLAHSGIQVDLVNCDGWSALMMSANEAYEGTVKFLLAHDKILVNLVNSDGWSALMLAARHGYEGTVNPLEHPEIHVNLIDNKGWSTLMMAANKGYEGSVKLLLAHDKILVNLVNSDGWSALMMAANKGYEGVVKLLLAHHAIQVNLVNSEGWSALMLAARRGYEGTIKLFLAHHEVQVNLVNSHGWSAFMMAASEGYERTVKLLLARHGIQVNLRNNEGQSAIMLGARYGPEDSIKPLLAPPETQVNQVANGGLSALMLAARNGHEGIIVLLLAHPDMQVNLVDNEGWSALMVAARYGHEGTVKVILAHPEVQINRVDRDGWSALTMAASDGHEGTVKLLLAHADIQVNLVSDEGWSALMLAASTGYEGTAKLLLAHPEIQVNLADNKGWSGLMRAACDGHEGTFRLLLAHPGIQVNLVDSNGWSALMLAASNGHTYLIPLLLAHPAIQVSPAMNQSHGSTALHAAAYSGEKAVFELLLTTGRFDVNEIDSDQDTAIKLAAKEGHETLVRLLLDIPNIDTMIRSTTDSHTAMSAAQANGHIGIVELLWGFESRNAAVVGSLGTHQSSLQDSPSEDGSDTDSSECYFDAEELWREAVDEGGAVI